jgi:hypothetical protein
MIKHDIEWAFYEISETQDLLARVNSELVNGYENNAYWLIMDSIDAGEIPEHEFWVYDRILSEI